MKTVKIVEAFTLTRNDGSRQRLTPGEYELEDEYADFWYVQAHSATPPAPNPPVGTQEYAELERQKIARRKVLDAAAAELADEARKEADTEHKETMRRRIIENVTKPSVKEGAHA